MSETNRWFKIYRVDTAGKIMDLSDPNPSAKDIENQRVRYIFQYTRYDTASGEGVLFHRHFIDEDRLRVLVWDLMSAATGKKIEGTYQPLITHFGGGQVSKGRYPGLDVDTLVSRQLVVVYTDLLRKGPAYEFRFVVREGRRGEDGQILPILGSKDILKESIYIDIDQARRLGAAVWQYLQAKANLIVSRGF